MKNILVFTAMFLIVGCKGSNPTNNKVYETYKFELGNPEASVQAVDLGSIRDIDNVRRYRIEITNVSPDESMVGSPSLSSSIGYDLSGDSKCNNLAPGKSCFVIVQFNPAGRSTAVYDSQLIFGSVAPLEINFTINLTVYDGDTNGIQISKNGGSSLVGLNSVPTTIDFANRKQSQAWIRISKTQAGEFSTREDVSINNQTLDGVPTAPKFLMFDEGHNRCSQARIKQGGYCLTSVIFDARTAAPGTYEAEFTYGAFTAILRSVVGVSPFCSLSNPGTVDIANVATMNESLLAPNCEVSTCEAGYSPSPDNKSCLFVFQQLATVLEYIDINPGTANSLGTSSPFNVVYNDISYFPAVIGSTVHLVRSDGTAGGTYPVAKSNSTFYGLKKTNSHIYYLADNGIAQGNTNASARKLFRYNPAEATSSLEHGDINLCSDANSNPCIVAYNLPGIQSGDTNGLITANQDNFFAGSNLVIGRSGANGSSILYVSDGVSMVTPTGVFKNRYDGFFEQGAYLYTTENITNSIGDNRLIRIENNNLNFVSEGDRTTCSVATPSNPCNVVGVRGSMKLAFNHNSENKYLFTEACSSNGVAIYDENFNCEYNLPSFSLRSDVTENSAYINGKLAMHGRSTPDPTGIADELHIWDLNQAIQGNFNYCSIAGNNPCLKESPELVLAFNTRIDEGFALGAFIPNPYGPSPATVQNRMSGSRSMIPKAFKAVNNKIYFMGRSPQNFYRNNNTINFLANALYEYDTVSGNLTVLDKVVAADNNFTRTRSEKLHVSSDNKLFMEGEEQKDGKLYRFIYAVDSLGDVERFGSEIFDLLNRPVYIGELSGRVLIGTRAINPNNNENIGIELVVIEND